VGTVSPLMKLCAGAFAASALLVAIGLWFDERFVTRFQNIEQITIRPEPRFRPSHGSKLDCGPGSAMAGGGRIPSAYRSMSAD
jgi:hypothetical protein